MAQRFVFHFNLTTDPRNRAVAKARTGGWSEDHWDFAGTKAIDGNSVGRLAQIRSFLLPKEASLTGWTLQQFTISGNKLLPGRTATFKTTLPGPVVWTVNIPQDALQVSYATVGAPNTGRFTLRAFPDELIQSGEYNGIQLGEVNLKALYDELTGNNQWGSLVRDLTQPTFRVVSFNGTLGTLVTEAGSAFPIGSYVILKRVRDQVTGKPISGSFRVMQNNAAPQYTLADTPNGAQANKGTCRIDQLVIRQYGTCATDRIVSRKIGRPSEEYRGRRSKKRV